MYESTIADHTAALSADPGNVAALVHRGDAYARQGDFEQAVADYTAGHPAAARRRRALPPPRPGLCPPPGPRPGRRRLHRGRQAGAAQPGGPRQPRPGPRPAQGVRPGHHGLYRGLASQSQGRGAVLQPRQRPLLQGRVRPGHRRLHRGGAARPAQRLPAFGNRGKAYALRGEHGKAVADFGRLLHLDPANVRAMWDCALSFIELGQYDKALADYDAAIRREPSAALYRERGQARAAVGDLEQAVADFTEVLAIDPRDAGARLSRAGVYHGRGEFREALADLNEALRLQPDAAVVLRERGDVQGRLGAVRRGVGRLHALAGVEAGPGRRLFPARQRPRRPRRFRRRRWPTTRRPSGSTPPPRRPTSTAATSSPGSATANAPGPITPRPSAWTPPTPRPTSTAPAPTPTREPAKAVEDYSEAIRLNPSGRRRL